MFFLIIVAFLTSVHLVCLFISIYRKMFKFFLLHDIAIIFQIASFYFGVVKISGHPGQPNYSVYMLLVFSLLTLFIFGYAILKSVKETSKLFTWRNGDRLLFIGLSLYIVFTVADHFWFFAQNSDESGSANFSAIKAEEVECSTYGILRVDGDEMVYRCPQGLMYGVFSNKPFIPWPGYFEARSRNLKRVYDEILEESRATIKK